MKIVIVFLLIICFLQLFIQTKETDSELRARMRRNDAIYNFRMYLILLGYVQKKDPKYYEKELSFLGQNVK